MASVNGWCVTSFDSCRPLRIYLTFVVMALAVAKNSNARNGAELSWRRNGIGADCYDNRGRGDFHSVRGCGGHLGI